MLDIFKQLAPFFEDNYRRVYVREYARLIKISPPSASKRLKKFYKEQLLNHDEDWGHIYYYAKKESPVFVSLTRLYWQQQFEKIGLLQHVEKELLSPTVILFGSFSKAEITPESDIDLAIFSSSDKTINLTAFEKKLKRKIQVFSFRAQESVENKELLKNILNGYILLGGW